MAEAKMKYAETHVFSRPAQVARIVVPDGNRVLLLMYGKSPQLAPIDEPGEYEIDAEILSEGRYPLALVILDLAHVAAWQAITAKQVGDILDRCAVAAAPAPSPERGC